uniref:Uncharacterized protein n=1 Tax=Eutreptiella gymnastica TaxID=73025 RepID=A0A7S1NSW5_9EUGL
MGHRMGGYRDRWTDQGRAMGMLGHCGQARESALSPIFGEIYEYPTLFVTTQRRVTPLMTHILFFETSLSRASEMYQMTLCLPATQEKFFPVHWKLAHNQPTGPWKLSFDRALIFSVNLVNLKCL